MLHSKVIETTTLLTKTHPQDFFARDTVKVAKELLGSHLCRRLEDGCILSGEIVEVEAYTHDDPACHAFRGQTKRNEVMFGPAGYAYVYFIYGMYFCLNVVTEEEGRPGAILIRGVNAPETNGPGKLCRQWQIDRTFNGACLFDPASHLWIAANNYRPKISASKRIGLSVAQERYWRFYIAGNPGVSGTASQRSSKQSSEPIPKSVAKSIAKRNKGK
jgi:DNA-3-methyladenine glycosylase